MFYREKEMKIILVCFMLLFVCSCHDNSGNSITDDLNKTDRSEEVLKIMREATIHRYEVSGVYAFRAERQEKLLNELSRMKDDFYYVPDPNLSVSIPGPDWYIKGPLPFENVKDKKFREKCKEGDELYFYRSDIKSWMQLNGCEGYVLIRDNKKAHIIVTVKN